jgi:exportin-T
MEFIFKLFSDKDDQVSSNILPFLNYCISIIRKIPQFLDDLPGYFKVILTIIKDKAQYRSDFNFDIEEQDEYEAGFIQYRKDLFVLYKNLGIVIPDMTKQFIENLIQYTLQNLNQLKFSEIEISLSLLYFTAEIFQGEATKPNAETSFFSNLIYQVIKSEISKFPHFMIQIMYFENIARFLEADGRKSRTVCEALLKGKGGCT